MSLSLLVKLETISASSVSSSSLVRIILWYFTEKDEDKPALNHLLTCITWKRSSMWDVCRILPESDQASICHVLKWWTMLSHSFNLDERRVGPKAVVEPWWTRLWSTRTSSSTDTGHNTKHPVSPSSASCNQRGEPGPHRVHLQTHTHSRSASGLIGPDLFLSSPQPISCLPSCLAPHCPRHPPVLVRGAVVFLSEGRASLARTIFPGSDYLLWLGLSSCHQQQSF